MTILNLHQQDFQNSFYEIMDEEGKNAFMEDAVSEFEYILVD